MSKSYTNPIIDNNRDNLKFDYPYYYLEVPNFYISMAEQQRLYNKYNNIICHYIGNKVHYSDDEFLLQVKLKYPFLSDYVTFSMTQPKNIHNGHIDGPRNASFNFPINNCGVGASTEFYKINGPYSLFFINESDYGYYHITGKKEKVADYTIDSEKGNAVLFRTTVPHAACNFSRINRVIVTWSIADFADIDSIKL